ncbi:MAG: von Willebrand factor type A domain-containing protein [Bacteroidota bacterium]
MLRYLLGSALLLLSVSMGAQTTIYGKVTDEQGEVSIGANVAFYVKGVIVTGISTDFDGNYKLAIDPGTYDVEFSYIGYTTKRIKGVIIKEGRTTKLDFQFLESGITLEDVHVVQYKIPLIEHDRSMSTQTITSEQVRNLPTRDVRSLASSAAGISQSSGQDVTVRGSRDNATDYYIDGIRVRGSGQLVPASENGLIEHFPGGVEAQFESEEEAQKNRLANKEERQRQEASKKEDEDKANVPFANHGLTPPPAPMPSEPITESYAPIIENSYLAALNQPQSTFSIDVDKAAYSNIRRFLHNGQLPPNGAIRLEEMINYFEYDYPEPEAGRPFSVTSEVAPCPWDSTHQLVHIGLQAKRLQKDQLPPSNLVFLVDVSGSMSMPNKLPLLKQAFNLLIAALRPSDRIAIVVYAGAAGLVLPSTPGSDQATIRAALGKLSAGGSTAGAAGIQQAYQVARQHFLPEGNNRVILATDGDFNVGVSSQEALVKLIEKERQDGIFLSVLGFGTGNYQDQKMEQLADNGNGNYAYIDQLSEAQKVLVKEFGGTLFTVAKDVKIQVEFNPAKVKEYRLIGYENRALENKDFNDDLKDAGEIGAGHSVTALYEIIPTDSEESLAPAAPVDPLKYQSSAVTDSPEWLTIKLRYKPPKEAQSIKIEVPVVAQERAMASESLRFAAAVAGWGLLLRNSQYKGSATFESIAQLAQSALGSDRYGYRKELLNLIDISKQYTTYLSANR